MGEKLTSKIYFDGILSPRITVRNLHQELKSVNIRGMRIIIEKISPFSR